MLEKVPNVLTGKDLNYLSDMFSWNYESLKKTNYAINQVDDENIKNLLQESITLFENNLKQILNILGGKNE